MVDGKILSFQIDVRGESEGAKRIAELDQSLAKLNQERREALKLSKESDAQAKKNVKQISALNSKITEQKRERQKLIAEEKRLTKVYQAGEGSVTKLRLKMQVLKATMEKLNLTTAAGQREFKRLNAQYQRGTTVLRKYDQRLSGSARLQGAFTKGITNSFKSMAAGLIGITAVLRVFREVTKVTGDFDSAQARLAATVGKTREEISDLTDDARDLGSTTQFTASQVSDLQVELAKLGFTAAEIQQATKPIIDFATAVEADLGAAASTAGVAVRAFGLDVLETGDAVATLAIATTKTALTFADYETILSTVGPVARAYNFTLEDTVALTGKLRDAGFDASKAGTATRNILLNLADANGALAKSLGGSVDTFDGLIDGLIKLDEKGIDLASTLELTDKRSVAAFNQFLTGAGAARELRGEITDVNDELEEMVKTRLDSYAGDVKLLSSAWEGLILTMKTTGALRGAVQFLTNAILQVSNLSLAITKFNKQTESELSRSFDVLTALTNKQGEHFSQMVDFFDEMTDEELLTRGFEQMAKDFALIRNVNKKEGVALAEEYLRRREETAQKEIEIEEAKQARILEQEEEARKKKIAAEQKEITKEQEKLAKKRAKEQKELNKALERTVGLLAAIKEPGELEALVFDIATREFSIEDIEADINNLAFVNESVNERILADNEELTKALIENTDERYDHEEDRAQKTADLLKQVEQEKINISADGANEIFNIGAGLINRQQQKLEQRFKDDLITEEKFNEEKAKLRRKQAAIDKVQALFNIALNTAIGASNAASKVVTLPLVPFIIGLGALQAGAVLAEPLPEFAFGGEVQRSTGKSGRVRPGSEMPWSTPQGDNTLVLAKPGEVYLNKSHQAALGGSDTFRRIGVPGFAGGGQVPGIAPPVPGVGIDVNALAEALGKVINDKKVIQDVNELQSAMAELGVIQSTNEL